MPNISDERLILAAVKGDCKAVEELKNRIKPKIRNTIKNGGRSYKGDADILEDHILNEVINSIDSYRFIGPFQIWIWRLCINKINAEMQTTNDIIRNDIVRNEEKIQVNKALSEGQRNLGNVTESRKHPPLENIDFEIRSLVSLLNQSPDICTTSSCSGHPDRKEWVKRTGHPWNPFGGWIDMVPTGEPCRALDFIVELQTKLDNTKLSIEMDEDIFDNTIRKRYQQLDANALLFTKIPIVIVDVNFRCYVCQPKAEDCLNTWKQFIAVLNETLLNNEEFTTDDRLSKLKSTEINTPEAAAKYLQKVLHQLPFMISAKFDTTPSGYTGISFRTKADLALLQRISTFANQMQKQFENVNDLLIDSNGEKPLSIKWIFSLQPFLNQELIPLPHLIKTPCEPRTREDHLKIWKLLELAAADLLGLN